MIGALQWTVFITEIVPFALYFALMLYAWARSKPGPSVRAWQIATAFGFSFLADASARDMMLKSIDNNVVMHFAAPIQFGLLLFAFRPEWIFKATLAMLALAWYASLDGFAGPEWRIQLTMGVVVAWAVYRSSGPYRWPVILYCAAGVPLVVWANTVPPSLPIPVEWLAWFTAYHGIRLLGLLAVIGVMAGVLIHPRRLEAARGLGRRNHKARGDRSVTRVRGRAVARERVPVRADSAGWHY